MQFNAVLSTTPLHQTLWHPNGPNLSLPLSPHFLKKKKKKTIWHSIFLLLSFLLNNSVCLSLFFPYFMFSHVLTISQSMQIQKRQTPSHFFTPYNYNVITTRTVGTNTFFLSKIKTNSRFHSCSNVFHLAVAVACRLSLVAAWVPLGPLLLSTLLLLYINLSDKLGSLLKKLRLPVGIGSLNIGWRKK